MEEMVLDGCVLVSVFRYFQVFLVPGVLTSMTITSPRPKRSW